MSFTSHGIYIWFTKISVLKLNFVVIIFGVHPSQHNNLHVSLTIGINDIKLSKSIKILGVTLDSKMNMEKHIMNTCRSSYMHIRKINGIRRYLSEHATKTLINSTVLVQQHNSTYVGLPQVSLHKLQLALNTAARVVSHTPRHEHITTTLQQMNWLPITKRCQMKLLVMTFKVLHQEAPQYIIDLFHWYSPARTLRSASSTSLVPQRGKTIRFGKRLIDTLTAALWNGLPNEKF